MSATDKKAKIGILGASGYTGAELVRLLIPHPHVEIALLTADRRAGKPMAEVFPQFAPYNSADARLRSMTVDWAKLKLDLVFCALPHGTTQKVIKDLLARQPALKVIDLSADFRLADPAAYARWYGHEHFAPELQPKAVYGSDRNLPQADRDGAACRQSRLLYELRRTRAYSAVEGQSRSIPMRSSSTPNPA